jgi:hypothetical protein
MDLKPVRFIGEAIQVGFDQAPLLEKKPGCPDTLSWQGSTHRIIEKLGEWTDYRRRGRMARNMQPGHAAIAETRGSWGVGRFYFRVQIEDGRIFDIYYDRAPKDAHKRKGAWFLYREIAGPDRLG